MAAAAAAGLAVGAWVGSCVELAWGEEPPPEQATINTTAIPMANLIPPYIHRPPRPRSPSSRSFSSI